MGATEDFARFTDFAKELFGDDEDTVTKFVNSSMQRKGYKPVTSWADPDPSDGDDGDADFFGPRKKRETRQVGGGNGNGGREKKESKPDWQYG